MQLTIKNEQLGTQYRLRVPRSGELTPRQVRSCLDALVPPSFMSPQFGPLGEYPREWSPPELPGVLYRSVETKDGGALLVPCEAVAA